jgi:hypothetical protein
MQNYISVLSRNGFLFNFSTTFMENIDYFTTCFNFNLENLYLSHTYFTFASEIEKTETGLKIFTAFTLIKKSKKQKYYPNPLYFYFFKKIEEIETDNIAYQIFNNAKDEFKREL